MRPSPERFVIEPQASRPIVGLVVDRADWHGRELAAALAGRGVATVRVRLELCGFATRSDRGLRIDGFGESLPDAVVVRSMSGGTFEAVTLRLGILHALRELGVLVWNDARAIERCVDKSMTSFLLSRAGIATPATWVTESYEEARAIAQRETADGAVGAQAAVWIAGARLEVDPPCRTICRNPGMRPAGYGICSVLSAVERDGFHDFRLLVVQGRVIAAMQRHSSHWITNVKRGGRPVAAMVNDEMKALAVEAAMAVGADFAGVDILYGADQRPAVLEVNSMPAWSGLQKVASVNIVSIFAEALTAALAARAPRGAMA